MSSLLHLQTQLGFPHEAPFVSLASAEHAKVRPSTQLSLPHASATSKPPSLVRQTHPFGVSGPCTDMALASDVPGGAVTREVGTEDADAGLVFVGESLVVAATADGAVRAPAVGFGASTAPDEAAGASGAEGVRVDIRASAGGWPVVSPHADSATTISKPPRFTQHPVPMGPGSITRASR